MERSIGVNAIALYLGRHAEPEAMNLGASPQHFSHVLVLPALDECELLLSTLGRIPQGNSGPVLIVLVINAPEGDALVQERSAALIESLRFAYPSIGLGHDRSATFAWLTHPRGAILLVDRGSPGRGLPKKGGVGMARKIGCDVALRLYARGEVESPWIHCTDADASLPADYFSRISNLEASVSLALYPFWHKCEPDECSARAIKQYELFLRYYERGLTYAGSPYAFQTLGSTIAVRALSYAQVRGFPRRSAAEDFYLINKVAKVGTVAQLTGDPILLEGRASHRVPFGTGRAVLDLRERSRRREDYLVYSPLVFDYLKEWLTVLNGASLESRQDFDGGVSTTSPLDGSLLAMALEAAGAREALREAKSNATSGKALRRRLHIWFDAFQTMKFIHRITEAIGKVPLDRALQSATFIPQFAVLDYDLLRVALVKSSDFHRFQKPLSSGLNVHAKSLQAWENDVEGRLRENAPPTGVRQHPVS